MHISHAHHNHRSQPKSATPEKQPEGETKSFTVNPQDGSVMDAHPVDIANVKSSNGQVETDTVQLVGRTMIFNPFTGQPIDLRPNEGYRLDPKADGSFNHAAGTAPSTATNAFGSVARTVAKYNEVYSELTGKTIEWAFIGSDSPYVPGDKLVVSPETGEMPNAFYARELGGVHFFNVDENISTGDSGEVVSHETGHAILDAIRPSYFSDMGGPEAGAFHEAFGDVLAFLMTLTDKEAVSKLVETTGGGDLSAGRNLLSDMSEEFGAALGMGNGGIRNSFNQFTYQDPATLPEIGSETQLGHEVHDFSRLWSGAFYDVLDGIADANREAGMDPQQALMAAGEEGFKLLIAQMENAPHGTSFTFKDMAAALMDGDQQFNGGARQQLIGEVMVKRELLTPEQASGLFQSDLPTFSGKTVKKEITLGGEFGLLAGVKVSATVDKPAITSFAKTELQSNAEIEKGVKLMMQDGDILFSSNGAPSIGELFKPNGEAYTAYVTTNEAGERELKRIPMAVCGHDHHEHHHH